MNLPNWVGELVSDEDVDVLCQDGDRLVIRAAGKPGGTGSSRLFVGPPADDAAPGLVLRLENEFALRSETVTAWAARPARFTREGRTVWLELEDQGGKPLSRTMQGPLPLERFLKLAIAMSRSIGEMHNAGLIHKDIKPDNILVNDAQDHVWLTGFGIASCMPRERQTPAPPEVIAGTIAYMAPEQTGRMNRSIDARSDLYALGVIFYQMLTGVLPFVASDTMDWIHSHIARQPVPAADRTAGIPRAVSDIVSKLMAKASEDRYRTAAGLHLDLEHCLAEWQARGAIAPFVLGARDFFTKLVFQERLYGRETELGRLTAAFERMVEEDAFGMILVSGYSGIGKSSVINELHRLLVPQRGLFAAGKFDQYKPGIPYAPLAQALQGLVGQLLQKSEAALSPWREALIHALGSNGQLIVNLVPDLRIIIGEQPALSNLSGPEAQNRFRQAFRQFVGVFARPEHPLVIFLDDLQWLDPATLEVFEDLATRDRIGNFLLVGAYRDNEVGPDHSLAARLETIRDSCADLEEISLGGISEDDVIRMIADALDETPERVKPLAHVVCAKAGGNPFFTTQFVANLVDRGLLSYDTNISAWRWDAARIRAQQVSDNIVGLMVERLRRLPEATQSALGQLACLGSFVPGEVIERVVGVSRNQAQELLRSALDMELLIQIDDSYAFAHDRVHEAAYVVLGEGERSAMHWQIGNRLLATHNEGAIDAEIFEIVGQLNRGWGAADVGSAGEAVARLNLRAARKAKASAAYDAACTYLAQGRNQLEQTIPVNETLAFALAVEHAECLFLGGNVGETERMIDGLMAFRVGNVEKAAVYRLQVELCVVKSDNAAAVGHAIEGLKLLGVHLPAAPTWDDVILEYEEIWKNLDGRPIESFAELPEMTDPATLVALRLLAEMQPPAYFSNFNMTILVICRMVNLCLKYGSSPVSPQGLVLLAYVIGPAFGRFEDAYRIARLAARLASERNSSLDVARVHHLAGLAAAWTEPLPSALDWLRTAYKGGVEAGDLYYACFEAAVIVLHVFLSGEKLGSVEEECRQALDFARNMGFGAGIDLVVATERAVASLQGRTGGVDRYDDGTFDEAAFEAGLAGAANPVVAWWYWARKTMVHTLAGNHEAAIIAADKARSGPVIRNMQIEQFELHYYAALSLAALLDNLSGEARETSLRQLFDHHEQLVSWARITRSPTFADKPVLISAEIARVEGRDLEAQRLYEDSIRLARENGFVQNEAVANEVAAAFYADRGFDKIARLYRQEAHGCYLRWGALAKARQMEELFSYLREETSPEVAVATTVSPVEQLDLATVTKVAQTVSGEIVLERLVDSLMRTAIEHAGAARAVLMLTQRGEYQITAEALTNDSGITVRLQETHEAAIDLSQTVVEHVTRTRETVMLADAVDSDGFSEDDYIRSRRVRSLLALPLINQGAFFGLIYLENNFAPNVFTANRIAVLKLIASHAAIALENTRLYRDLEEREARIRRLIDANIIGVFMWKLDGSVFEANDLFLRMVGFDRQELASGKVRWTDMIPPEDRELDERIVAGIRTTGLVPPFEREFVRKNGSRVPVLIGGTAFGGPNSEAGVSFVLDLTDSREAEALARESDLRYRALQAELAHANRVATVGHLSAAISHDVRQPLVGVVASGDSALNWLGLDPPNIPAARRAIDRVVREGQRAAEVLERTHALLRKLPPKREALDINDILAETTMLLRVEAARKDVVLRTTLKEGLRPVHADRIQVQQVVLNLAVNAIEAMAGSGSAPHDLSIVSDMEGDEMIVVAVRDTGPGLSPEEQSDVFNAFYSTKPEGMGMGLVISRTIVESHGGKLWAEQNEPRGAVFCFTLPLV